MEVSRNHLPIILLRYVKCQDKKRYVYSYMYMYIMHCTVHVQCVVA
jgi:hypothetical protein